ncbi:MAG: hypothetical protein UX94_C0001G0015 [Parcubacteria group bacterium GW2011_GWA2_47_21]|nr:MAG: hypothetical protein UX94_C0001G0015 [Parcubacteria group bacterium GW2011_GWA2_47_21]
MITNYYLKMEPRTTKNKWTISNIKDGFERFFRDYSRYPTATEIDGCDYLPSSRQIQRRFGGLPRLRETLKLKGVHDFTKGEYSSNRAKKINKRSYELETQIYRYLLDRFGKPFVHREYLFNDDRRTRTDFFVFCSNGNFSVDVFYPSDKKNMTGCINSKLKTYSSNHTLQYPVIFLMMNDEIQESEIEAMIKKKTKPLKDYQKIMTMNQFKKFCEGRKNSDKSSNPTNVAQVI